MGILWWILDPIIFMFIFYLVFDVLMLRGEPGFLAFLLTGLVTYQWFQNTVGAGTNSIQSGQGLMQQVYLPKVIFPLVYILTDLFKFSLIFILLLIFLWFSGRPPGITYLALPLLLLIELALNRVRDVPGSRAGARYAGFEPRCSSLIADAAFCFRGILLGGYHSGAVSILFLPEPGSDPVGFIS